MFVFDSPLIEASELGDSTAGLVLLMAGDGASGGSSGGREVDSSWFSRSGSKARRLCIFAQIAGEYVMSPLLLDVLVVIVERTSWFGMLSECTPFGYEVVRERLN
jgi:hypothetical protein